MKIKIFQVWMTATRMAPMVQAVRAVQLPQVLLVQTGLLAATGLNWAAAIT